MAIQIPERPGHSNEIDLAEQPANDESTKLPVMLIIDIHLRAWHFYLVVFAPSEAKAVSSDAENERLDD
jgi:hypothetical protein